MSTESGGGGGAVPSFGDLFDEPEAPVGAETAAPAPAVTAPPAEPVAAPGPVADAVRDELPAPEPIADEPEFVAPLVELDDEGPGPTSDDAGDAAPPQQGAESAWSSGAALAGMDDDGGPVSAAAASPDLAPSLAAAAGAAAMAAPVQTGRLFRSTGAEGPATLDAIPAIDPEYMAAREAQRAAEARKAAKAPKQRTGRDDAAVQGSSGLTWSGVVVIVLLGTVLVAFADAIINDSLGILTGIALLVSSVYCALLVRRADIWAAVVVPPLAFLAAALTAGQLTLDSAGSFVVREGYMLLKTLAQNAPWVIGTTLVCLVIVLVRLRRSSTAEHA